MPRSHSVVDLVKCARNVKSASKKRRFIGQAHDPFGSVCFVLKIRLGFRLQCAQVREGKLDQLPNESLASSLLIDQGKQFSKHLLVSDTLSLATRQNRKNQR